MKFNPDPRPTSPTSTLVSAPASLMGQRGKNMKPRLKSSDRDPATSWEGMVEGGTVRDEPGDRGDDEAHGEEFPKLGGSTDFARGGAQRCTPGPCPRRGTPAEQNKCRRSAKQGGRKQNSRMDVHVQRLTWLAAGRHQFCAWAELRPETGSTHFPHRSNLDLKSVDSDDVGRFRGVFGMRRIWSI